jgi:hypothetical protein
VTWGGGGGRYEVAPCDRSKGGVGDGVERGGEGPGRRPRPNRSGQGWHRTRARDTRAEGGTVGRLVMGWPGGRRKWA